MSLDIIKKSKLTLPCHLTTWEQEKVTYGQKYMKSKINDEN